MDEEDRADPSALSIGIYLDGRDDPDRAEDGTLLADDDFLVLVNAWWEPLDFTVPSTRPDAAWQSEIDTSDPEEALLASGGETAPRRAGGDQVTVGPRSVVVLKSPRELPAAARK